MSELEVQEVRPVTPDHEAMEAISRTIDDRSHHVQQVQCELLQAQSQHDLIDEQEYYAEVRVPISMSYCHVLYNTIQYNHLFYCQL